MPLQPYPLQIRAWERQSGTMLTWLCLMQTVFNYDTLRPLLYEVMADPNHRFVKMLSTGLSDKTGKLIYDGDILEFDPEEWGSTNGNRWVVRWDVRNGEWFVGGGTSSECDSFKTIIGNIFENPELVP